MQIKTNVVFLTQIISCRQKNADTKVVNEFQVDKNGIHVSNFQKSHFSKYSIKRCSKQITFIKKFVCPCK